MIAKLVTIASDIGELTADKLEEFKREKFPKIKDSVASAVKYILLLIFVSIALISIGIYAKIGWFIFIGGLLQVAILAFAYAIAELIGILFSIITFGKHSASGVKTAIRGYTVIRFIIIILLLLLPARANLSLLPVLLMLSFFIELLYAMNAPRSILWITISFSALIVLGMFSPGGSKLFARWLNEIDSTMGESRLFQATPEAYASGNIDYYDSYGSPRYYRCFDDEKRYIILKDAGFCQNNGAKALPISESDRIAIKKYGAKIISPRCLLGGNLTSSSATTHNKPAVYVPPPVKKAAPEQQVAKPAPAPVQIAPSLTQTAQASHAPVVDMSSICRHSRRIVDWGDASSTGTPVNIECSGNSVILRDTEFGTVFDITKNIWNPGTGGGPFYFHMEPFSQGDTFAKGKITIARGTVTAYLREEAPEATPPQTSQNVNAGGILGLGPVHLQNLNQYKRPPMRVGGIIENLGRRYNRQ